MYLWQVFYKKSSLTKEAFDHEIAQNLTNYKELISSSYNIKRYTDTSNSFPKTIKKINSIILDYLNNTPSGDKVNYYNIQYLDSFLDDKIILMVEERWLQERNWGIGSNYIVKIIQQKNIL